MRLLVVGYAEYDSGKTSLTLQLIRKLRAGGRRVIAAKPIAGHSAWYQYETVVHSAELGLLVGEDAYRIAVELGMLSRVAVLNPVDLLISPLDPFKARGRVEEPLNIALMRITLCSKPGGISVVHYVCDEVLEKAPPTVANAIRELASKLRPKPKLISLELAKRLLWEEAGPYADKCIKLLIDECEDLIVESFNNAATPTPSSLETDYVLAVAPGRIDVFEGSEYRKAVEVLATLGMWTSLTVGEVSRYIKPLWTVYVEPASNHFVNAYDRPVEEILANILVR